MAKNKVKIEFGEVPRIEHVQDFMPAAAQLAVRNCAYVIAGEVASTYGPVTRQDRKIGALVWALNTSLKARGAWTSAGPDWLMQTPRDDYGMHSNPYDPTTRPTSGNLRWHNTPEGSLIATFAQIGPDYFENRTYAHRRLTDLMAEGLTDPRYADPTSFTRAQIGPDESIVFRFDDGTAVQPHPYLHDFRTIAPIRTAALYDIYREI